MATLPFNFQGIDGSLLSGELETPETTPRGWAIFAHCFTCGKRSLAAVHISRALSRAGIGVMRFDFSGVGTSEGDGCGVSFSADIEDLKLAAQAMTHAGMTPTLLVGHSLGGCAALIAANSLPDISAVATISAPADLQHILSLLSPTDLDNIDRHGGTVANIASREFLLRRSFIESVDRTNIEQSVSLLRRPLLIMHAPNDPVVGIEHASRLFIAAIHPKSFVSLDTADHLLTDLTDSQYVATTIAAWASRYMPQRVDDVPQVEFAQGVSATETLAGKFQLSILSAAHSILADEPPSVGGLGSGLSPYELVSAGLAACSVMTMRLYADRKGYPLARASTTVEHTKVSDMVPPDRFTRTVILEGPLDDEQRKRILAIADRCPVDLTLVRGADVQTRLVDVSVKTEDRNESI